MLTLNLPYPERSDIKFEIINFPDGHKHLKIIDVPIDQDGIKIFLRAHSVDDIFIGLQATSILHRNNNINISMINPYAFGARCDRRFSAGEANDFDIITDIITLNSALEWTSYDVHGHPIIGEKADKIFSETREYLSEKNILIAYPDMSAYRRYYNNNHSECIYGEKVRDGKDKLHYESLHNMHLIVGRDILVRDDIIDGGLTFIEFAKLLKKYGAGDLYLHATHGIFSKGYDELLKHYKHIYCTNSYKDVDHPGITCYDVYN